MRRVEYDQFLTLYAMEQAKKESAILQLCCLTGQTPEYMGKIVNDLSSATGVDWWTCCDRLKTVLRNGGSVQQITYEH